MWLSQRKNRAGEIQTAQMGRVTLSGDPAGVYLDGERRNLPVFGPGGYCWRPELGEKVLVIKAGADGEEACVAGAGSGGTDLSPGEICIRTADGLAAIRLSPGGAIALTGYVSVNGQTVGPPPEKEEEDEET